MVSNLFGTLARARIILGEPLDSPPTDRVEVDPGRLLQSPLSLLGRCVGRSGTCGRGTSPRVRPWPTRTSIGRSAATAIVARRRRRVHHFAAGLYRGPRASPACALQPGHVSDTTFRGPILSRTRKSDCTIKFIVASACITRPQLAQGRAAAGERLCRWLAGHESAAVMPLPEGMTRIVVRRSLGRPADRHDSRHGDLPIYAEADFTSPAQSSLVAACPRVHSAIIWAITAWRTNTRCCKRRARLSPSRRDLAVHRRGPSAAGRHGFRPIDPRA